jgi:hypothetical protein
VPTIDWQKYKDAVKPLLFDPQFAVLDTFRYLVGWLVVGYTVRQLWRREYAVFALLAIVGIVLAGRIVVVGKVLVPSELLALVICIPLAALIVANPDRRRTALLVALLAATIVLQGDPFGPWPSTTVQRVPFRTPQRRLGDIRCCWKCLYFSLVWLSHCGQRLWARSRLQFQAIELAQLWLPGDRPRSPIRCGPDRQLLALLGDRPAASIRLPP